VTIFDTSILVAYLRRGVYQEKSTGSMTCYATPRWF